jgi:tetratricopeptide (TPR) repeat protein
MAKKSRDTAGVNIFYSYSHKDEELCKKLITALSPLRREGLINNWYDRKIGPGEEWRKAIDEHLDKSRVILLLISPDFVASDYCYDIEMGRAMELFKSGKACVIPIILRPADWHYLPFAELQALPKDGKPVTTWPDEDEAFLEIAKCIRSIIQKPALVCRTSRGAELPLNNLPFGRNLMFTGREELLKQVHEALKKSGRAALSQPPAIHGLGGIGKTQIAIEYAYRHIKDFKFIFWVGSENETAIRSAFSQIAGLLNLPQKDERELGLVVSAVKTWLESHKGWLSIFDNADDPHILRDYLPRVHQGKVLITSRASAFGNLARGIEVDEMPLDRAVEFLLKRAGIKNPGKADIETAEKICEALGLLPLAIDQAGSFLEQTRCSLDDYLESYQKKGIEVLKDPRYKPGEYKYTVATTWAVSFEKLNKENAAALDIMNLIAFFAPDSIPLELLEKGAESLDKPLKKMVSDSYELNKALGDLQRYSLVKRRAGENEISMHRLLQAVIIDNLGKDKASQWAKKALACVKGSFPDVTDYRNWPACAVLLPHFLAVVDHTEKLNISMEDTAYLLNDAGLYLKHHAEYAKAESLYRRDLKIYEEVFGPEHPLVATSLNNLGTLYESQGKYAEAEPHYQRALKIYEKAYGHENRFVATSLSNLGLLYHLQGKYTEAEPLYQTALKILEKISNDKHPDVARSLNNLGGLYYSQGKYTKAEPLYRKSLEIREKALPPKHPDIAESLNNLALLYQNQGKYSEAEPLYQRSLEIREKVLGPEHPRFAQTLLNLGTLAYDQGNKTEGVRMLQRAYKIYYDKLGPDHPDTKIVRSWLEIWGVKSSS